MIEVDYLGGIAKADYNKKYKSMKARYFLEANNFVEVAGILIDTNNLFARKFDCCLENCDFFIKRIDDKKTLFKVDNKKGKIDWTGRGCCEGGSLEIPNELIETIDDNLDGIKKFMDDDCLEYLESKNNNWKHKISKDLYGVGSLPKDNRCIFTTISEDGMPLCALHAYALSKNEDVLKYKPFECAMFPLDIITFDDKPVLTAITTNGNNLGISRWGAIHCSQKCIGKNTGKPMYEFCKDTIISVFGEDKYKAIDKYYKEEWDCCETI